MTRGRRLGLTILCLSLIAINSCRIKSLHPGGWDLRERSGLRVGAAARTITPADDEGRLWQEPYTDVNGNGRYDAPDPLNPEAHADPFTDLNGNGKWDGPFLAGFKHKGPYYTATGVHDPLWARAIILQFDDVKIGLVALDLVGLLLPEVERIRQNAAGLGLTYLLIASTHTHEGPDTIGLWGPNPLTDGKDPRMMNHVRLQTLAALREAERALSPARITLARTSLPGEFGRIIRDRRDPIVVDDRLTMMKFEGLDGRTLATIVNGSIHPETLGDGGSLISSDFPHYLREGIENGGFTVAGRRFDGLGGTAIYFNGAVGGLMTTLGVEVRDETGETLPQHSFEKTQRIGELIAGAAIAALEGERPSEITGLSVRTAPVSLPLDNRFLMTLMARGVIQRETTPKRRNSTSNEVGQEIVTEVGRVTIRSDFGPLAEILAIPGEIFPEIILGGHLGDTEDCWEVTARKKAMDGVGRERIAAAHPGVPTEPILRDHFTAPFLFVVGLANDELGYIVPANDFVFPTYAPGPVYGEDRCGSREHYEETLSASSALAPLITHALLGLMADRPGGSP